MKINDSYHSLCKQEQNCLYEMERNSFKNLLEKKNAFVGRY